MTLGWMVPSAISAILMIAAGLYFSTYFSASPDKAMLGTLFTVGFTIIPAAGLASFPLALMVIESLIVGVGLAVICSWMVYPFFPEDKDFTEAPPEPVTDENSNWMALRVTLIVLPPFLAALANPALYLKLIMKSVVMGKQATAINARAAGRELLGATFLGGALAIVLWIMLDLVTNLWMFFWLMLLMGIYVGSKIYQVNPSRFSAPFWVDVMVTMIILLGSAVQDSADGQDVYQAFTMRMSFFVLLALYAWLAIVMLDRVRNNHVNRKYQAPINKESEQC